jgi:soluble lytic murein transglycosylase-like protein
MKMKNVLAMVAAFSLISSNVNAEDVIDKSVLSDALHAMVRVESGGDPNAVGDKHLVNKAYGVLQIRKPYLDDVVRLFKESMTAKWGRILTIEDMKDPSMAWWTASRYLEHYGRRYYRLTGSRPGIRIFAALHNGGPNGWKKSATNEYCDRVVAAAK